MANQIRLKRASGSDPSASDLVTGELAVRTDTAKLFTKKDDNSVAEIGGISDGDKGDITVSSSGTAFTIDDNAVTYAKMQDVSATNRILGRDSSGGGIIEEITPANLRTMLNVADGATNVTNTNQLTNGAGFITATLTNEQVQDIIGGMLTGNTETGITVTYQDGDGTIDFSVASQTDNNFTNADHSKLDGIESGATADQSASEIVALIADQTIAPSTIDMEDDEKILLGSGDDLELFHDGGNSFIRNATNDFIIQNKSGNDDNQIRIRAQHAEESIVANGNGSVDLYFNNSKKAETVTGGFTVTGTCTATAFAGDGSSLTGISAGATGGGSDEVFYENDQTVTTNYTITNGKNAMSAGPITINSGVTVTVGSGETLTIV